MQIHLTEATVGERVNSQQCYTMSLSTKECGGVL